MNVIKGNFIRQMDMAEVAAWAANYDETTLDLGTGDGRFVRELARKDSTIAVIGLDLCAANFKSASRNTNQNALFVVADALTLPHELRGVATQVTVNFPWGSLLRGMLDGRPGLATGLARAGRPGARLRLAVNAGALAESGWPLQAGSERVIANLDDAGFSGFAVSNLGPEELRRLPTTWAKRLAFGRDPRAVLIEAVFPTSPRRDHGVAP